MNGPECEHWKEAKDEEMRRLQQYNTYKLVIPPPGANIVGSRWSIAASTMRTEMSLVTVLESLLKDSHRNI